MRLIHLHIPLYVPQVNHRLEALAAHSFLTAYHVVCLLHEGAVSAAALDDDFFDLLAAAGERKAIQARRETVLAFVPLPTFSGQHAFFR